MQQESDHRVIQTLDIENNCLGIYSEKFFFENFEEVLNSTPLAWSHSPLLSDQKYVYLSIYLKAENLLDYSSDPASLKACEDLIEAQKKAAMAAKLDFSDMCFFDVLPDHLMIKWFNLREKAILSAYSKIEKPKDYDILHKIHVLAEKVSRQEISVGGIPEKIKYDIFSSSTGRLTTKRGSFPILNVSKEERSMITPQNDLFLELDLNGAEIRTLLALSGQEQPTYDIHEYNGKMTQEALSRQEIKARFFAWLYNPDSSDSSLEALYDKCIYKKHYKNGHITTPFGRRLEVDERKALNYLTQSTTSDIVLESAYKIMKFLENRKSFISFTMHDSVVLDFAKEDHVLVGEIKELFENNIFGKFLSTVNIGRNFGKMKELQL